MSKRLYDGRGRPISLGKEIGRGGEGSVVEVIDDQGLVAKLYHKSVEPEKVTKLRAMTRLVNSALLRISAWPTGTLHSNPQGELVGILLPKIVNHREIHQLYSPVQRKVYYPKADWAFLFHVAMNCAAAFETVHDAGHVIGDVNQGGVLVSEQGTIRLIDCDSFQVRENGSVFGCVVGVPEYTPPELQGHSSFRGVPRTQTHDCFGLAILVFQLLFMGRHPFMGRYNGADTPIERFIAEGRFVFSRSASSLQIAPPPHSLGLEHVHPQMAVMFEKAFARPSQATFSRPTALEWRQVLLASKESLRQCQTDSTHRYLYALNHCPWCRIEETGGPPFFVSLTVTDSFNKAFDLAGTWGGITAVGSTPNIAGIFVAPPPKNLIPVPLPVDAQYKALGPLEPSPNKPELILEELPSIPAHEPLIVPDDPVFAPLPTPRLPPFVPRDPLSEARKEYRRSLQNGEYRLAKYGTAFTVALTIALLWLSIPLAVGASVLIIPFAISWLIAYLPRRRLFRAAIVRHLHQQDYERVKRTREEEWVAAETSRIEVENQQALELHQREIEGLAQLRIEAPQLELQRRHRWEAEVQRVQQQRQLVEHRNEQKRAEYARSMGEYERRRLEVDAYNLRIIKAQHRWEEERRRRVGIKSEIESAMQKIREEWATVAVSFQSEFQREFDKLADCKRQYEELLKSFEQDMKKLTANQEVIQLRDFLKTQLLEDADIDNIGPGRKRMLAAYGIETAFDLDPLTLMNLPRFGPVLVTSLLGWKQSVSQTFRFDATKAVSAIELRALHMKYHNSKSALERELRGGREKLMEIQMRARKRLAEFSQRMNVQVKALAQAVVDLNVM